MARIDRHLMQRHPQRGLLSRPSLTEVKAYRAHVDAALADLLPQAPAEARALIKDGTISGGMIPKVETCIDAIKAGVQGVVILNGKTPHSVLLEIFTERGAGTLIVP